MVSIIFISNCVLDRREVEQLPLNRFFREVKIFIFKSVFIGFFIKFALLVRAEEPMGRNTFPSANQHGVCEDIYFFTFYVH